MSNRPTTPLIFDRTEQDVLDDVPKGQLNISDLNRVESWCRYLADKLLVYGYNINITTKTNWTQLDKRKATEMERIRSNIRKIMTGYYYLTNIEPNAEFFNYVKANNWEKILFEIDNLASGMSSDYIYAGVSNAGQNRVWQARFRRDFTPYTRISQIISTGTQWIDTGVLSQVDIKVQLMFALNSIPFDESQLFGNEITSSTRIAVKYTDLNGWEIRQDNRTYTSNVTATTDTTYFLEAKWTDSNCSLSINTTEVASGNKTNTNTGNQNLKIFRTDATGSYNAVMKLYSCKIFKGDELIRNFIPVLDNDNVACLYDTITDSLFYNSGTGNFNY